MKDLYCTFCHRECSQLNDDDPDGRAERLSDCHAAPTLVDDDKWIVMAIRRLWAADGAIKSDGSFVREDFDPDYPFGTGLLSNGESPLNADFKILEAFRAERAVQADDLHTIWVLIRG